MKIHLNSNRHKSGLGIIAVIIFVIALLVVVGTMVYLIYKLAKKLDSQTPIDPTSTQVVDDYQYSEDVYVFSQESYADGTDSPNSTNIITPPRLSITKYTTESGENISVLSAGEYFATGAFDLVYERSTNMVNWEPFNTNYVSVYDLRIINDYGEISYTNEVVFDTNMHPCMFYRAFIRPL